MGDVGRRHPNGITRLDLNVECIINIMIYMCFMN